MNIRAFLSVCVLTALVPTAMGIIVINSDETENLATPPDGSPWNYVGRLENHLSAPGSAVYLGSRYVLTASHLIEESDVFFLNGVSYARDTSFTQVTLQNTDMRILRIVGDPGLPRLPLIEAGESEFNQACTLMGYGVGKGTPVPNQGWNWGDDATRLKRWATNKTQGAYRTVGTMKQIVTAFDKAAGNREGQLTGGDSGGALFVKLNGVWKLVGINVDVDVQVAALYDTDPNTPGNQPDHSYYAAVKPVLSQILAILGTDTTPPPPPTGSATPLKDISTDLYDTTPDSVPQGLAALGNTLFFFDDDPESGRELWKSDGTVDGTVLVKDINPGPAHGSPQWLTPMGGALYFVGTDDINGTELWKSDGTTDGTALVKDINPGAGGSNPRFLTVVGSTLYFSATDGIAGTELWKSDGSEAGTVRVKDINAGSGGSSPQWLTAVSGRLYFQATDPANGAELWKSDGTAVGTVLVKNIVSGKTGSTFQHIGILSLEFHVDKLSRPLL